MVVVATDAVGNESSQTVTVDVTDFDEIPPEIQGFSGEAGAQSSSISMDENLSSVGTFTANESVTWSISGGVDKDQFSINSSTGSLSLKSAPDYENPDDSDQDNSYKVTISATDAANNISCLLYTSPSPRDED